jgi:hypothetical protein
MDYALPGHFHTEQLAGATTQSGGSRLTTILLPIVSVLRNPLLGWILKSRWTLI